MNINYGAQFKMSSNSIYGKYGFLFFIMKLLEKLTILMGYDRGRGRKSTNYRR